MSAEIPEAIKPLVDAYIATIETELPGFMSAFYLHGSIALGDFHPRSSDIDFVTVISRQSTAHDLESLKCIHHTLKRKYPQGKLSGSYLQARDLGQANANIQPHPHYDNGVVRVSGFQEMAFVTWWTLKYHGLALVGPELHALHIAQDWDEFIVATRENMSSYWVRFTREPVHMAWLLWDYGIQWAVLGVLRQFYTLNERYIASKTRAGEYGLAQLPARWHRIIQEALSIRNQSEIRSSLYGSRLNRAVDALRFLRFLIDLCNTRFT